jgi:hypothetical protein
MKTIILIIIIGVVEFRWNPRFDITRDGDWILWYGTKNRKYFKF